MARPPRPRDDYTKEVAILMALAAVVKVDANHDDSWRETTLDKIASLSQLLLVS